MKISVITINFNNLPGLKATLESVLGQTSQDFEYIIIDGGSTDGSKELIEAHTSKITYWVCEKDYGIYNAMNKGLKVANGDYVIHMNSGDTFHSAKTIEEALPLLRSGEDVICGSSYYVNDLKWGTDSIWIAPQKMNFRFFSKDTINHQSVFIKKSLFDNVGFYREDLKAASDWAFFVKAFAFHHATYKQLNIIVSNFDRSGFSSANWAVGAKEQEQVLRTEYQFFYDESGSEDLHFFRPLLRNYKRNLKRILKFILPYGLVRFREMKVLQKMKI